MLPVGTEVTEAVAETSPKGPLAGVDGRGSHFGGGGDGGRGAEVTEPDPGQRVGKGGCGGKGFGGETLLVPLNDLSLGDRFNIAVGTGGGGGDGGKGFRDGGDADPGANGWVLFAPILPDKES